MDGYQLRTKKKKEAIKHVAFELFIEYGIDKVSLSEIAKKANVSPVTIYNHFGTKEELVKTVIASFFREEWENRIETTKRDDLTFHEKIEKMIMETSDFSGKINPDFMSNLMNGYPELKNIIGDIYQEFFPHIIHFFEEGKKLGYIDPDIATESIIHYLEIIKKASDNLQFTNDKGKNSKLANDLAKLFFYGLLRNPEEKNEN
ncbi:TetR/AcrR family transcriptional regulator [Evansella halocellulosilytica]|uniref:TetR/AcrR family transcriptional regulator n=1 Tax=Evansella halocellulosilytica TaxID=2011013 RepID=UPI000BB6E784|nr:TetR/AcrR family transcriptional regulator [Evansella halocellulosilytica]